MNCFKGALLFLFLFPSAFFVDSYRNRDLSLESSFLEGNALDISDELSEAFLSELEIFNEKVLEKLADRMINVLNTSGFDLNKEENVDALFTFLQEADVEVPEDQGTAVAKPSFKSRLLQSLKKAATGIGKEALMHATRAAISFGIKESLPNLEIIFKRALNNLPLRLKIAVAPLAFKMWTNIFKKAHVDPPKHFTLRHIILDGLSESDRKLAEEYID
ncbi:hypothetical protein MACK_000460 [Theileria orientalis]|uniref:Uncharacterized protein n=1 Tax=Theileria orientalis TaxID=68886 RepID=A0A976MC56_THEOR|nr:hypothetical protein MACK_000460 [Theileria orientalis]